MARVQIARRVHWIVLLLLICANARADGLIYGLPPDGVWVEYKLTEEGKMKLTAPDESEDSAAVPVEVNGTLRLSSVGQAEWEGIPCRWIELKLNVEIRAKAPDALPAKPAETSQRQIILKMLIPEAHLTAGSDPFAHVQRLYYKDGGRATELINDEKDHQYQLDRFRPVFPEPVANTTSAAGQEVETPHPTLGRLNCEKLTFDSSYEGPLTGGRRGWWSWQGDHEVWLHKAVPFGVAALRWSGKSDEWTQAKGKGAQATVESTKYLAISEMGHDATSELPESR